jgi:hypothetical protein
VATQSCGVSFSRKSSPADNPPPTAKVIEFDRVDLNNDGRITKEEAENYNSLEKAKKSQPNLSGPLAFSAIIVLLIFIICGGPKAYNFILSLFRKK